MTQSPKWLAKRGQRRTCGEVQRPSKMPESHLFGGLASRYSTKSPIGVFLCFERSFYATLLSAAFSLASASLESELFRTRGLKGSISGSTLSSVTLLNSTKSADEPAGIVSPSFRMKSSLMP
jgi:hypothetical protein